MTVLLLCVITLAGAALVRFSGDARERRFGVMLLLAPLLLGGAVGLARLGYALGPVALRAREVSTLVMVALTLGLLPWPWSPLSPLYGVFSATEWPSLSARYLRWSTVTGALLAVLGAAHFAQRASTAATRCQQALVSAPDREQLQQAVTTVPDPGLHLLDGRRVRCGDLLVTPRTAPDSADSGPSREA